MHACVYVQSRRCTSCVHTLTYTSTTCKHKYKLHKSKHTHTHTSGVHSYVIMQTRCKHMCSSRQMRLCTCVHIQTSASSLVYLQMQVCQCLYTQTRISTQTCTQTCLCIHMLTTNLPQCKDTTFKKKNILYCTNICLIP